MNTILVLKLVNKYYVLTNYWNNNFFYPVKSCFGAYVKIPDPRRCVTVTLTYNTRDTFTHRMTRGSAPYCNK